MAAAMVLTGSALPSVQTEAAEADYEIYPNPHVIEYQKNRLTETLELKSDVNVTESEEVVDGMTNILVGIDGSGEYADTYVKENITVSTDGLFEKLDSYVLDSSDNIITVLGADTDASFYGLTTLYHIIKQMDSYTIRNFHIEDWADVASRGFIEGYYGNPWSTQDRINLM